MPDIVAHVATYPARAALLAANIAHLRALFPRVEVCLNDYRSVPEFLQGDERVSAFIPDTDLMDAGKFAGGTGAARLHFLVDDDLRYPDDYVTRMVAHAHAQGVPAVVGVHGVDYRFWYRGGARGRRVFHFRAALDSSREVDALGTGTVLVAGIGLPPLAYMQDAAGFVDIRFARWCAEQRLPRICVSRPPRWLDQCRFEGPSLFDAVTRVHRPDILREVDTIRRLRRDR